MGWHMSDTGGSASVLQRASYRKRRPDPDDPFGFRRRVENAQRRININQTALVYFVLCDCPTGFIKIGMAADPEERVINMQTSCPYPLRVLATMPGGMAAEREMHERFADACVGGEWFRPVPDLLKVIAERQAATPPPKPKPELSLDDIFPVPGALAAMDAADA